MLVVSAFLIGIIAIVAISIAASGRITMKLRITKGEILDLLPNMDCGQCGYCTCIEYADAAVSGEEAYRKCDNCSDGFNSRISLMWARPKEDMDEEKQDD